MAIVFSNRPADILYIDINSCFASIEQQDNPKLRGKPIAVAPYQSPHATIVAASIQAKKYGINTGCHIREAKKRYPAIIIVPPRHQRYQTVHEKMFTILKNYTPEIKPVSIDEFCLDFACFYYLPNLSRTAQQIKREISQKVGPLVTVSAGIAPNRLLAKTACELKKPNGLSFINRQNFPFIYQQLPADFLWGVGPKTKQKLQKNNIRTVLGLYQAPLKKLQSYFSRPQAYRLYWHLRGFRVAQKETTRKSFGNSRHLPYPIKKTEILQSILQSLICRTCFRLQKSNVKAKSATLTLYSRTNQIRHTKNLVPASFDPREISQLFTQLLAKNKIKTVKKISFRAFDLIPAQINQLGFWQKENQRLLQAINQINSKYKPLTISLGRIDHQDLKR